MGLGRLMTDCKLKSNGLCGFFGVSSSLSNCGVSLTLLLCGLFYGAICFMSYLVSFCSCVF